MKNFLILNRAFIAAGIIMLAVYIVAYFFQHSLPMSYFKPIPMIVAYIVLTSLFYPYFLLQAKKE